MHHSCEKKISGTEGINKWFILVLLYSSFPLLLHSQVFPLKTDNDRFLTKRNAPFLLNARSTELPTNIADIDAKLLQLGFRGINTVIVNITGDDISFNEKGSPQRILQRKTSALKRLARQADLKNMAVMIFPNDSLLPEKVRDQCLRFLFNKLHGFQNVLWVLNRNDLSLPSLSLMNPKQLRGIETHVQNDYKSDFIIVKEAEPVNAQHTKPVIFRISDSDSNDSIMHLKRVRAYAAMLKGASGIAVMPEAADNNYPVNHLFASQISLLKSVFDTCNWFTFDVSSSIIPGIQNRPEEFVISAMSQDSSAAVVYLPLSQTFPLDLRTFGNRVKLTWINALTGEVHHSSANGKPDIQLFIPPVSANKFTDWLLIIRRDAIHSTRTGF